MTTTTTNSRPYHYCTLLGFNVLAQRTGYRWLLHVRDGADPKLSRVRIALDVDQLRELAGTLQEAYDFTQRTYHNGQRDRSHTVDVFGLLVTFEALSNDGAMWAELGAIVIDIDKRDVTRTVAELKYLQSLLPND